MRIIIIYEWDITYQQFVDWVKDTEAEVYSLSTGGFGGPEYLFEKEDDFLAFTLKFKKKYLSRMNIGYFYGPYIPLQIYIEK